MWGRTSTRQRVDNPHSVYYQGEGIGEPKTPLAGNELAVVEDASVVARSNELFRFFMLSEGFQQFISQRDQLITKIDDLNLEAAANATEHAEILRKHAKGKEARQIWRAEIIVVNRDNAEQHRLRGLLTQELERQEEISQNLQDKLDIRDGEATQQRDEITRLTDVIRGLTLSLDDAKKEADKAAEAANKAIEELRIKANQGKENYEKLHLGWLDVQFDEGVREHIEMWATAGGFLDRFQNDRGCIEIDTERMGKAVNLLLAVAIPGPLGLGAAAGIQAVFDKMFASIREEWTEELRKEYNAFMISPGKDNVKVTMDDVWKHLEKKFNETIYPEYRRRGAKGAAL